MITITRIDDTSFSTNGDQRSIFIVGRRLEFFNGSTIVGYGEVTSNSFAPNITEVVCNDITNADGVTANLPNPLDGVYVGVVAPGATGSIPRHVHSSDPGQGGPITLSGTVDHGSIGGLQGGTSGEYYHLTAADYADRITATQVNTISGSLQDQLDNFSGMELHGDEWHNVDYALYTELTSTSGALHAEITSISGIVAHGNEYHTSTFITSSALSPYATIVYADTISGALNVSKADAIHTHDDRYYTEGEVDTISGALNTKISAKQDSGDYALNSKVDTASGTLQTQINNLDNVYATDADVNTISGVLNGKIITDHGGLTGLSDNDHPQYDFSTASGILNSKIDTTSGTLQTAINGKAPTSHSHDDLYYTETELNAGQLDNRYYTETEVNTISGALNTAKENAFSKNTAFNKNFGTSAGDVCQGNDGRLSDARTPTSHGNAQHTSTFITSTDVTYENLNGNSDVGTGATQVAAGNHTHGQLHDRSHTMTSTSDHTSGNWKLFHSNGSGELVELALGATGKVLTANGATSAPTFETPTTGSSTFLALTDTPANYTDAANKYVKVNAGADALEFVTSGATIELVDDTSPQLGGDLDTNGKNISLTTTPADDSASGLIATLTVDTNGVGVGAALFMAADGNFDEADADAATTMPCTALALETSTGSKKVLLQGFIRNDDWTWTVGGLIYVSTTQGTLTQTAPAGTGDQVQIVGFATHADRMFFNPNYAMAEVK